MKHASNSLSHIKDLRNDMINKGWSICVFDCHFNGKEYFVTFEIADDVLKTDNYAVAVLTFHDVHDLERTLEVKANSAGLDGDDNNIIEYFGIDDKRGSGDFCWELYQCLDRDMPAAFLLPVDDIRRNVVLQQIDGRLNSEHNNGRICYSVRRLGRKIDGTPEARSPFIDDKTKMLYGPLYKTLRADRDTSITFCYHEDGERVSNEELIRSFMRREQKRNN
jgi:hypothetical protein